MKASIDYDLGVGTCSTVVQIGNLHDINGIGKSSFVFINKAYSASQKCTVSCTQSKKCSKPAHPYFNPQEYTLMDISCKFKKIMWAMSCLRNGQEAILRSRYTYLGRGPPFVQSTVNDPQPIMKYVLIPKELKTCFYQLVYYICTTQHIRKTSTGSRICPAGEPNTGSSHPDGPDNLGLPTSRAARV